MTTHFLLPGALAAIVLLAWWLTDRIRRYALRTKLLDQPNARSSHTVPTPRGGGVAIVAACLLGLVLLAVGGLLSAGLTTTALGAGLVVAALGFWDDRQGLPARWRFAGHLVAALWLVGWIHPLPPVPLIGQFVEMGIAGTVLCVLFVVWMINLFNFMDGIDGIASVEALFVALAGAGLWVLAGSGRDWLAALVFGAAVTGFLIWNFPPARIFMGDAGSGFVGLMLALLALWCARDAPTLFWAWFILLGCFMVDATTTLVRRVRRGERFFEAHRAHAYQYASRKFGAHRPVTMGVAVINVFWLLPLATAVALRWLDGVVGVALAYTPLLALALHFKAGDRAGQASLA